MHYTHAPAHQAHAHANRLRIRTYKYTVEFPNIEYSVRAAEVAALCQQCAFATPSRARRCLHDCGTGAQRARSVGAVCDVDIVIINN